GDETMGETWAAADCGCHHGTCRRDQFFDEIGFDIRHSLHGWQRSETCAARRVTSDVWESWKAGPGRIGLCACYAGYSQTARSVSPEAQAFGTARLAVVHIGYGCCIFARRRPLPGCD